MNEALALISSNSLVSALVAAAVLAIFGGCLKWYRDYTDSNKILDFMRKSKSETKYTFRSSEAISSYTKLTQSRVEDLCSKHPMIMRNENQKQSWRMVE